MVEFGIFIYLKVPGSFDSLMTIDMFFKCHKVFNIQYAPGTVKLMHFIDQFIFGGESKEIEITQTMKKNALKLNIPSAFREEANNEM